jgi:hypothetical protein
MLALASLFFCEPARADANVRIVVFSQGNVELARKVVAEAAQAGLQVVVVAGRAGEYQPELDRVHAVALVAIQSEDHVELYTAGGASHTASSEQLARRPSEGDAFPLRVVEQLRARLLELNLLIEAKPPTAADSGSGATASPVRPMVTEARAVERQLPAPAPVEDNRSSATPRSVLGRSSHWLRAGTAGTLPFGGVGPTLHAALGWRLEARNGVGADLSAWLPLMRNSVSASEGAARIDVTLLLAGLHYSLLAERWVASVGVGGGTLVLDMRAEAQPRYVGREERMVVGIYCANASAGFSLSDRLALRAALFGGGSAPTPAVRFDDRVVAAWGRWFGALSLHLEVGIGPSTQRSAR